MNIDVINNIMEQPIRQYNIKQNFIFVIISFITAASQRDQ